MILKRSRTGFTLIELLTVIAIIAVIAAILMPVFARVKENARQATCMSNMHELYLKTNLYQQDHAEKYPPLLFGVAENLDGSPWTGNGTPVRASMLQNGYLFPSYVRSLETFRCPNNPISNETSVVNGQYHPTSGFSGPVLNGQGGISIPGLQAGATLSFYAVDSYDTTATIGGGGARQLVYSLDWTNATGPQDAPHQLKYPKAPPDKSIIAWCNMHVVNGGSDRAIYVTAAGTAKTISATEMNTKGWNLLGR